MKTAHCPRRRTDSSSCAVQGSGYEKQGYVRRGEIDFDEECPHIWMGKEIGGREGIVLFTPDTPCSFPFLQYKTES